MGETAVIGQPPQDMTEIRIRRRQGHGALGALPPFCCFTPANPTPSKRCGRQALQTGMSTPTRDACPLSTSPRCGLTFVREFGVGAALMVLIDAGLVRGLLVPSLMVLFGEANWWAPVRLQAAHDRVFHQRTWVSATRGGSGCKDCCVSRSMRGGGL